MLFFDYLYEGKFVIDLKIEDEKKALLYKLFDVIMRTESK